MCTHTHTISSRHFLLTDLEVLVSKMEFLGSRNSLNKVLTHLEACMHAFTYTHCYVILRESEIITIYLFKKKKKYTSNAVCLEVKNTYTSNVHFDHKSDVHADKCVPHYQSFHQKKNISQIGPIQTTLYEYP